MAGYDGYSKSNSALDAEEMGEFPASIVSKKLKIPTQLIKAYIQPTAWHHTSSHFNHTDYFDLGEVQEFFKDNSNLIKNYKKNSAKIIILENCCVEWLDWYGSRAHPQCDEMKEYGAIVEIKGQTATITLTSGKTFKKRLTTRGFSYTAT